MSLSAPFQEQENADFQKQMIQKEEEIKRLQATIQRLLEERKTDFRNYDSEYETLLSEHPDLVNAMYIDSGKITLDQIKNTKCSVMFHVLTYFDAPTPTKQRKQLMDFLKAYPAYKTTDMSLLVYRFNRLRSAAQKARADNNDPTGFYRTIAQLGFVY